MTVPSRSRRRLDQSRSASPIALRLLACGDDVTRRESRTECSARALAVEWLDPGVDDELDGALAGSEPVETVDSPLPDVDAGSRQEHAVEIACVPVGHRLVERCALLEERRELLGVARQRASAGRDAFPRLLRRGLEEDGERVLGESDPRQFGAERPTSEVDDRRRADGSEPRSRCVPRARGRPPGHARRTALRSSSRSAPRQRHPPKRKDDRDAPRARARASTCPRP